MSNHGASVDPGWISCLEHLLAGTQDLPHAACRGRGELFDRARARGATRIDVRLAVRVCESCKHRCECTQSLTRRR